MSARKTYTPDGGWRDGRASPELLAERLRELPSVLVTKDEDDEARVHALDPEHVRSAIAREQKIDEWRDGLPRPDDITEAAKSLEDAPIGAVVPLTQARVDVARFRMCFAILSSYQSLLERGVNVDINERFHAWFPTDNVNDREIRKGNPPSDQDRPKHLQCLDLWVDPLRFPESILDKFQSAGFSITDVRHELDMRRLEQESETTRAVHHAMETHLQ